MALLPELLLLILALLILGLALSPVGKTENTLYTKSASIPDVCSNTALVGESPSVLTEDRNTEPRRQQNGRRESASRKAER